MVITVLPPSSDVCCIETAGICGIMPGIPFGIDIDGMPVRLVRPNCASVEIIPLPAMVEGVGTPVVDEMDETFDIGIEEKGPEYTE